MQYKARNGCYFFVFLSICLMLMWKFV